MTHSPDKPVIVFVSSRRQTRLTARDLVAFCGLEDNPRRFLKLSEYELESILLGIRDPPLRLSLGFGIGIHHAGLVETDRRTVEELFVNNKIQILVATSTLAWGVNFPAHLVVIKGTEYYDAKTKGYVDFPITDVLQMMGRAGRPQFDDSGVARVFVHDVKKNFYKKFLHEPFPVESSLHKCLADHFNAEIVTGSITSMQDAIDYLTWTYFYRRLQMNPTFYGLEDLSPSSINLYLSRLVSLAMEELKTSGCIEILPKEGLVKATPYGRICSYFYLHHTTIRMCFNRLPNSIDLSSGFPVILNLLADAAEFDELPVRHNEDLMNQELEKSLPVPLTPEQKKNYDSPHVKAFLLLQAHLIRLENLPCADYATDTISVLDQSVRVLQAMIDISAEKGYLSTTLCIMTVMQYIKQGIYITDNILLSLPRMKKTIIPMLSYHGQSIQSLTELLPLTEIDLRSIFVNSKCNLSESDIKVNVDMIIGLPKIACKIEVNDQIIGNLNNNNKKIILKSSEEEENVLSIRFNGLGNTAFESNSNPPINSKISAPRFPKPQQEGWWLILGDSNDQLINLRRIGVIDAREMERTTIIKFKSPLSSLEGKLTLFLISDGYIGIDQQIDIDYIVTA